MISITDIYDEVGFIKNILQDGLSEKWVRDIKLLTRYYKSVGMKPREIIPEIKNKCLNNKKFNYNTWTRRPYWCIEIHLAKVQKTNILHAFSCGNFASHFCRFGNGL